MSENKTIWITGANGYLGHALLTRLNKAGYDVVGTDIRLDITDEDRMCAFAQELRPLAVINCAGIRRDATTLSNRIRAYEVNAMGAKNTALAAEGAGAIAIQVSSDDVYSSHTIEPVNEFDSPNANTPYGKSKRAGETLVRDITPNHIILRSSWLYSAEGGRLKNLLDAAEKGEKVEARTDQLASPTSIDAYTSFLIETLEKRAFGTFNAVTRGKTNRLGFAARALELCGYNPDDVLIPTEDPSTAENMLLEGMMGQIKGIAEMPTWEEDLETYLKKARLAR